MSGESVGGEREMTNRLDNWKRELKSHECNDEGIIIYGFG